MNRSIIQRLLHYGVLSMLVLLVRGAAADGGAVVASGDSDGLRLTLFAEPFPLRAQALDISAMVQEISTGTPLLSCEVKLELSHGPHAHAPLHAVLTRAGATNKLLHHALVTVPKPGQWQARAEAHCDDRQVTASARWSVGPPPAPWSAHWPYLAFPGLVVLLFLGVQHTRQPSKP